MNLCFVTQKKQLKSGSCYEKDLTDLSFDPKSISVPDNEAISTNDSETDDESDEEESIDPKLIVSTLDLIGDYIRNLSNAQNTVVGVITEYISYSHL